MDCVQSFEGRPPERLNLICVSLRNTLILLYPNSLMRVLTPMPMPTYYNANIRATRGYFFLSLAHVALLKLRGSLVSKARGGGGGGTWTNLCWVCAAGLSEPLPNYSHILWPIIDPILVTFG